MMKHGLDTGITDTQIESQSEKLIYPNARITNATSMLLIMTFAVTHKLSGEALKDLLTLIDMHCLIPHALIQSLYKFKKYFDMLKHPINKHHYCPSCCMPIDMQCSNCPNASCEKTFASNDKPFYRDTTDQFWEKVYCYAKDIAELHSIEVESICQSRRKKHPTRLSECVILESTGHRSL